VTDVVVNPHFGLPVAHSGWRNFAAANANSSDHADKVETADLNAATSQEDQEATRIS